MSILVVDDEQAVLRITQRILAKAGYKVMTAETSDEAKRILEIQRVKLCITDYIMPSDTGLALVKHIRGHATYASLPVIVHSGSLDDQVLADFEVLPPVFILKKPVTPDIFLSTVKKALKMRNLVDFNT